MSGSWPVAAEARAIRLISSPLQSFVTPLRRPPLRSGGSRAAERGRSFTLDALAGHAAAGFSFFCPPPFISCGASGRGCPSGGILDAPPPGDSLVARRIRESDQE